MQVAKKPLIIILLILLVVAAGLIFWNYRNSVSQHKTPAQKQSESKTGEATLNVENKKIKDATSPFNIEITYPTIADLGKFNTEVENIVQKNLAEFKEISLENDAAIKETDPEGYASYPREYYFSGDYVAGEISQDIVSVVLRFENYTGGAHGAHYFFSVNYSLKDNTFITLADLFPGQPNYLQKVSDFSKKELERQIAERSGGQGVGWVAEGASPREENFSIFLVEKDAITFYFPEYQVAAYAYGHFQVKMPR